MASLEDANALFEGTPYRIVSQLARGGMGLVLAAEHRSLGKPVVIKVLRGSLADRPDLADRLRLEAQTVARLRHPNLVDVTDLGRAKDGRVYLVMERLYGRTFGQELDARGALPVPESLEIIRQVLAGLSAAHEVGVIHRDIKLDNLFLCDPPAGQKRTVKILDFGIAKLTNAIEADVQKLAIPTALGMMIGTPRYLAPEQARGEAIDNRADLYAVGVVLYALLAGRGPFHHLKDAGEVVIAQVNEPPPPPPSAISSTPQSIPAWLDAVVMKAIERDRTKRYRSAADFAEALAGPPPSSGVRWDKTVLLPTVGATPPAAPAGVAGSEDTVVDGARNPASQRPPPSADGIDTITAPLPPPAPATVAARPWFKPVAFLVLVALSTAVFMTLAELVRRATGGG